MEAGKYVKDCDGFTLNIYIAYTTAYKKVSIISPKSEHSSELEIQDAPRFDVR